MNSKWVTVSGVVVQGYKVAASASKDNPYSGGTISMQKPFFKKLGLDLAPYHEGTLNISIHPKTFAMRKPEYTFRKVHWTNIHPPEDFSFSRCFIISDGIRYEGLVYYPHPETKKMHFANPAIVEVICQFIPGIQYGKKLKIMLNREEINLSEGRAKSPAEPSCGPRPR
jgi:hypothetical protein